MLDQKAEQHAQVAGSTTTKALSEDEKRGRAWHYHGYPELAKWMASSASEFFVLRRYSSLTARCLLSIQHQIAEKEEELHGIDLRSIEEQPGFSYLDCLSEDSFARRAELLEECSVLLRKYFDLVKSFEHVRAKPTAGDRHIQNLDNWFETYPDAIRPKEQHFRMHGGDLFPMLSKPRPPLATLLRNFGWVRRLFLLPKNRSDRVVDSATIYWSDAGFSQAVCAVTVGSGLAILFAPMWWLYFIDDGSTKLGIITAFVTLFAFWLWVAAGPKQFEILLGTAAYAAVLYIYLQASSGGAPQDSVLATAAVETSGPAEAAAQVGRSFRA